ncbi:MAG TPA: hypothetical protein PKW76_14150 [bacterium]|nr:hypothetical protein [bacterium]HPG46816.1 hypothetical protein [bacterium]HPM98854.1 hypothetical protein [bacterium]
MGLAKKNTRTERAAASTRIAVILAVVAVFAFAQRVVAVPISGSEVVASVMFFLLMTLFLLLQHDRTALTNSYQNRTSEPLPLVIAGLAALVVLVMMYAAITDQLTPSLLWKLTAVLGLPTLAVWGLRSRGTGFHPWDAITISAAWALTVWLWVPAVELPPAQGLLSPVYMALVVWVVFLYRFLRPLEDMGMHWRLRGSDWRLALNISLVGILVLLILGFLFKSVHGTQRFDSIGQMVTSWVLLAVWIALPQEILFRGILQNLLQKRLAAMRLDPRVAIAAVSAWVGVLSLGEALALSPGLVDGAGPISWRNGVLAFSASVIYGWAFQKSGKLWVAVVVHTLVVGFLTTVFVFG